MLYREERARELAQERATAAGPAQPSLQVKGDDGAVAPVDEARLSRMVKEACDGLDVVPAAPVLTEACRNSTTTSRSTNCLWHRSWPRVP